MKLWYRWMTFCKKHPIVPDLCIVGGLISMVFGIVGIVTGLW